MHPLIRKFVCYPVREKAAKSPHNNQISHKLDCCHITVLESAGVPATGGPPMYKFIND